MIVALTGVSLYIDMFESLQALSNLSRGLICPALLKQRVEVFIPIRPR